MSGDQRAEEAIEIGKRIREFRVKKNMSQAALADKANVSLSQISDTLTIPSWSSSIDRVRNQTDLSIISSHARDGLIKQLYSLVDHVSELLGAIEED